MTNQHTVSSALSFGLSCLNDRLETELLLADLLGKSRTWLIAHDDEAIRPEQFHLYKAALERRLKGEPIAYITGHKGFWRHDFVVSADVLVPRPETEQLVECVLEIHPDHPARIADLGTGSGAIAISLALENPSDTLLGVDASIEALKIARLNRQQLGARNLQLCASSWLTAFAPMNLDIIVSNPPYIAANDEHLPALSFEPTNALVSGNDGLDDIRLITTDSLIHLTPGGSLVLEHGYDQQEQICALLEHRGYQNIRGYKDIAGNPRLVVGQKP